MQHLHVVRTFERTEGSPDVVSCGAQGRRNGGLTTGLAALLDL